MSFGLQLVNDNGQTLISDSTYNLVYIGKATYNGQTYTGPSPAYGAAGEYWVNEYTYTIYSSRPVVPFIHSATGDFYCVNSMTISGNTYTIRVFSRSAPTIYCFSRIAPGAVATGYGLAVYDSNGELAFSTSENHMIPKLAVQASHVATNCRHWNIGSIQGSTCDFTVTSTPYTPAAMVKPAILYGSLDSAVWHNPNVYASDFFCLVARVNGNTIETRWSNSGHMGGSQNAKYVNQPASSVFVIGIDGADYD